MLGLFFFIYDAPVRAEQIYIVDPAKSAVRFKVNQIGLSLVNGGFKKFSGSLVFDGERLESFEGTVDTDSLSTGIIARDRDLKADHFFAVKRFPRMVIKSSRIIFETGGRLRIMADITIRDMTKRVELKGTAASDGKSATAMLQGVVRRKDFGLRLGRFLEFFVGENVNIVLKLNAV
jgi:polyisoprenoid-binding protein YceI